MQYFPLFVDTQALSVLVVGAGEVASRKLALLARTEASLHVIAPDVTQAVISLETTGRITLKRRCVLPQDMANFDLIYLATADEALNIQMAKLATAAGIWVNVVDNPKFCRFITPSIIDRDKLVVAISTAGAAPVFARSLRARLEALLPQSLGPLFDFVATKRDEVQQKVPSAQGRRRFWEQFFSINGDKCDADTASHFDQSFDLGDKQGSLLLLDENTLADLLPLGVMPMFSKLDCIYAPKAITFELNELLRRDAERSDEINPEHLAKQWALGEQMLVISDNTQLLSLKAHFPAAQHIISGSF